MDKKNKNIKLFSNLHDAIFELLKQDMNEVDEVLKESNIDIEKLNCENLNFIKDLQAQVKIQIGTQKAKEKESIYEKARNMIKKIENVEEFLLKHLAPKEYEQLSFEFRNLNLLDEETKINLLNEFQLLKLMEILLKEKGNK